MAKVTIYGSEREYDRGGVEAAIISGLAESARNGNGRVESVRELRFEVINAGPGEFGNYFTPYGQTLIVRSVCRELVRRGVIRPCYTSGRLRPEVQGYYLVGEGTE